MCSVVVGSGRLFRRQKDIPVFIEVEFYSTPRRNVVKGYGVLNAKHRIWIGSSSQMSQYLYEFLLLSVMILLSFPLLPLFCVSGPGKGICTAGRFRLGARGCRGLCCVGRIYTSPCYQGPQWCHALLYSAWYVCVCVRARTYEPLSVCVSACFCVLCLV